MPISTETPEALTIFVSWGGAVLILFALISGIAGFTVWMGRQLDKRMTAIANQLDRRTQPIQSGYENDGNSLTDISNRQQTIAVRQSDMSHEIADLRESNDIKHKLLSDKVDKVTAALSRHAASPAHDQRVSDERTRSTDHEE